MGSDSKNVIMVCSNGRLSICPEMVYNGMKLTTVTNFTYLGVTLSYNGKLYMTQKKMKLFDSLILPICMHGVNVWGLHKANDVENVR